MRPHPSIRRTIKWGGTAATLVLVATWIASGRSWYVSWQDRKGYFADIGEGCISVGYDPDSSAGWTGVHVGHGTTPTWYFEWWPCLDPEADRGERRLTIPLWIPATLTLLTTAAAWRLDTLARRRARAGHCPSCGYNLTGLIAPAPCPECGTTRSIGSGGAAEASPPERRET